MTEPLAIDRSAARPPVPIGVFDSGIGGLSVLRALHRRLPQATLRYVGDVAHAPYGERAADDVIERCERIAAYLAAHGAGLIVVACNTATALAIDTLRRRWPALIIVGVEPGVKPAVSLTRSRRIAVMATPATCASARLRHLVGAHASDTTVHLLACAGLADAIERGLQGAALDAVLRPHCEAVRATGADTVVLGCTHYPLIADAIGALLGPAITLVDTAPAIAARVASLWQPGAAAQEPPSVRVLSTGATLAMQTLLRRFTGFEDVAVEALAL